LTTNLTRLDNFRLDGQTALVTGCRRGIGRAIAVAMADAGADVVGVSATLEKDGGDVARDVKGRGRRFRGYAHDFSDRTEVYELIEELQHDVSAIDVLVNNAGTILRNPASEHSDADWDRVIETNLTAQFVLSREIGKRMLERGRGKIIFVASLLSFQGGINVPSYSASKGGVAQLTKALANEWAARGINVNAVAPGYIRTDNTQPLWSDPARYEDITARIPAGRWGTAQDIAGAVVFLASAAADYVHGEILTVDGGWMGR
jgi:2-deoxy-D-gluconate 3-dehydrogenase